MEINIKIIEGREPYFYFIEGDRTYTVIIRENGLYMLTHSAEYLESLESRQDVSIDDNGCFVVKGKIVNPFEEKLITPMNMFKLFKESKYLKELLKS